MPKNLSYSLTPLADADMLNILLKGVEEWGVDQAASYAHKIHGTLHNLAENPDIGKKRDDIRSDLHSFPVGSHTVIYRHNGIEVEVVRVLHQRMDVNLYFT